MRRTLCPFALLLIGMLPATARADTLTNANGTLTYTADQRAIVSFQVGSIPGRVIVFPNPGPATAPGCSPPPFNCDGVMRIEAMGSPESDTFLASVPIPSHLVGGAGDDDLEGNTEADLIDGGPGNEYITGLWGADTVSGGPGVDTLASAVRTSGRFTITLDGIANDGLAGQGANVEPDVENVDLGTDGPGDGVVIEGSAAANVLDGGDRADVISGGAGNDRLIGRNGKDTLRGDDGNDTLVANDDDSDEVDCGAGDDTAIVDKVDHVSADCEHVSTSAVGNPVDDHPPTVAWAQVGSRMSANATMTLRADASDDRAVTNVKFLSGSRVVCVDSAAPYTCAFRPLGADVGRTTLTAVATDALGQTTTATRMVVVTRFKASRLSLEVTRGGVAHGKLTVSSRATCSGSVRVTAGSSKRTARLSRACRYSVRLPVRHGRAVASFTGTKQIAPRRSSAREF
jgi:Ca2+-binding RTX toxin-like protein